MSSVYVIGDIHGCIAELHKLEAKIAEHAAQRSVKPFIVSVGDLIDRGPESVEVVEHFYHGVNNGTHAVVAGNHEQHYIQSVLADLPQQFLERELPFPAYALRELNPGRGSLYESDITRARERREIWFFHGGKTTIAELGGSAEPDESWFFRPELMRFLCELPVVWFNQKVLVTHALVSPHYADLLTKSENESLQKLNQREYSSFLKSAMWSRDLPEVAPDAQRTHVSGHTAMHAVERHPNLNLLRIDTSCVYGYELTAWCADTDELLSVPSSMPCYD